MLRFLSFGSQAQKTTHSIAYRGVKIAFDKPVTFYQALAAAHAKAERSN